MRRNAISRKRLCVIFCGLVAFAQVLFSTPTVATATTFGSLSLTAHSPVEVQRSKIDDVLDSYGYFFCYQTSSHNNKVFEPVYRTLTYRNGYTRKYPDALLYSIAQYPCPTDPTHNGMLKRFSCSYETY